MLLRFPLFVLLFLCCGYALPVENLKSDTTNIKVSRIISDSTTKAKVEITANSNNKDTHIEEEPETLQEEFWKLNFRDMIPLIAVLISAVAVLFIGFRTLKMHKKNTEDTLKTHIENTDKTLQTHIANTNKQLEQQLNIALRQLSDQRNNVENQLVTQRTIFEEQLKFQTKTASKQSFENQFFNLLRYQHDILNDIELITDNIDYSGRKFFKLGRHIMSEMYRRLLDIRMEESLKAHVHINGWMNSEVNRIKELGIRYNAEELEIMKVIYKSFFGKFHNYYAHYFRNLSRLIGLVIQAVQERKILKDEAKVFLDYIEGGMSADELFLLFYNSLVFTQMKDKIDILHTTYKYDIFRNFDPYYLIKLEHKDFFEQNYKHLQNSFLRRES